MAKQSHRATIKEMRGFYYHYKSDRKRNNILIIMGYSHHCRRYFCPRFLPVSSFLAIALSVYFLSLSCNIPLVSFISLLNRMKLVYIVFDKTNFVLDTNIVFISC